MIRQVNASCPPSPRLNIGREGNLIAGYLKRSRRHGEDSSKYNASSRVFVAIFEAFGSVV